MLMVAPMLEKWLKIHITSRKTDGYVYPHYNEDDAPVWL